MTLIEIVAAVAISGLVVALGAALLDQIIDAGARIGRDAVNAARAGNGRRLLRQLLSHAEASLDTSDRFRADSANIGYRTRCPTEFGWTERCRIHLVIDYRADSSDVVAVFENGREIPVRSQASHAEFRFLDFARIDSTWATLWTTSATLPDALALVAGADTLIMPVGPARDD